MSKSIIIVTGASGMVGRHVMDLVHAQPMADSTFVFLERKDVDLRDRSAVEAIFDLHKPTHVLHCAARLASASEMTAHPVEFWMDNVTINNNVLHAASIYKAKVVSVLSSVMFNKDAAFPIMGSDDDIFGGQLHPVSQSYGFAKRALAHLSRWYRDEFGLSFSCVLPSNIFGPYGDFKPGSAPLLNALISKAHAAKLSGSSLQVMGSGKPERQMLYAGDLARVLLWALENFDSAEPLLVAGEEVSVGVLAEYAARATGSPVSIEFDTSFPDGPLRRTADTSRLRALYPDFAFTPLADAIGTTYTWYVEQAPAA